MGPVAGRHGATERGAGTPLIQCTGVAFRYAAADGGPTLHDIHMNVYPCEFVAILGGNGSGKSTLARLLDGLLQPTEGSVRVAGLDTREARHLAEVRRRVGLVFQNPDNQIVSAVVEDDVAFGPENLGLAPEVIAVRVQEALHAVGMSAFARSDPHHLSGGQKQRVAIAGVLAVRPDCLCLDEPTSLLDPVGRAEVRDALRRLGDLGCARVLITHYAEEAAEADRVVILHHGRMVAEGAPRAVFCEIERLASWGVQPPPATWAWSALRARGAALPDEVPLTLDELARQIGATVGPKGGAFAAAGRPFLSASPAAPSAHATAKQSDPRTDGGSAELGIRLSDVRYTFADPAVPPKARRPALDGIDVSLAPGECLAVLGATGSGKSTVALHCCALLQPQAGTVAIDGTRPWELRRGPRRAVALRACRRRAGLVFQYPEDQFFEERVLDEIAFAPRNYGASPTEAAVAAREALARVGLPPHYSERNPLQLSGGEMRRVAIASLLAARPNYLLLDEPTAGLDARGRADLAERIHELKAAGIGILLITHRMEEAAALADRVAVLRAGRIVATGTPRQIFARGAAVTDWDLLPPAATQWLLAMRREGVEMPTDALTMDEAIEVVARRMGLAGKGR